MKVWEYEQLTKEEKIQHLIEEHKDLLNKHNNLTIWELNAQYYLKQDIKNLQNKETCQECQLHKHDEDFCTYTGRKIVDFASECSHFIKEEGGKGL